MARVRPTTSMALCAAALAATLACATHNFDHAAGPRYDGFHAPSTRSSTDGPLLIVTLNIQMARRVDRAIAVFRDTAGLRDADIVLLQEMDGAGVERFARELAFNYAYFPSTIHPWSHREFGTAVLSRWPLDDVHKILLPYRSFITNARRAATSVLVHRGSLRVRVLSVHLPAPGSVSDDEREEQVRLLTDSVASTADPVVIGGDFNARRVGPWFTRGGFTWLTDKLPGTTRALGRWWSYDHVFVRGLRAVSGEGPAAGVVNSAGASDHRAVWVRVSD